MEDVYELSRSIKLKGSENWSSWKFLIKIKLRSLKALSIIEGDNPKPVSPTGVDADLTNFRTQLGEWEKLEGMAQSAIVCALSEQVQCLIRTCETAKSMWDKLESVYGHKSETSTHLLSQQWYQLKKEDNETISTYVSKVQDLAHRMSELGDKVSDPMVMTKILLTLPDDYDHFCTAWESTAAAERTLINLVSRLVMEETRKDVRQAGGEGDALAARRFRPTGKKTKTKPDTLNKPPRRPGLCNYCKNPGHWIKDCRKKKEKDRRLGNSSNPTGESLIHGTTFLTNTSSNSKDSWYLDSGASHHMTGRKEWFSKLINLDNKISIRVGDGNILEAISSGFINILAFDGQRWSERHLDNVLYIPELKYNLVSMSSITHKNYKVETTKKGCTISKNNSTFALADCKDNLFLMKFKVVPPTHHTAFIGSNQSRSLREWHEGLGHQNYDHVKRVLKAKGIPVVGQREECQACILGKMQRVSHPSSKTSTSRVAQLIHTDVCGPFSPPSFNNSKYFLLFKDDFSHYRHVYFIKQKSDVTKCLKNYLQRVQKETGMPVDSIRSDNGCEFINKEIKRIVFDSGIKHEKTVPYTPEQNGKVERDNRTLVESARTMLHSKKMSTKFWAEAINTAVYVLNRSGTSSVKSKTPFDIWHKTSSSLDHLRPFGSNVMVHIPKEKRKKLHQKAERGIMVGYNEEVKGYRVWLPDKNRVEIHCDIKFLEMDLDDKIQDNNTDNEYYNELRTLIDDDTKVPIDAETHDDIISINSSNSGDADQGNLDQSWENDPATQQESSDDVYDSAGSRSVDSADGNYCKATVCVHPPARIRDWVGCDGCQDWFHIQCVGLATTPLDNEQYLCINCDQENVNQAADGAVLLCEEPTSYNDVQESNKKAEWVQAMNEEMEALNKNKTWTLVDHPKQANVLTNRWVFKVKQKSDGSVERYKARLVVKGYQQKAGFDYSETFSPVVKFDSIRMMLTLAASKNMHIMQFDIKTAFLYGEIKENVYMIQPEGFNNGSNQVCKLNKSLYGLKQAPRCWNRKFVTCLEQLKLKSLEADPCVFRSDGSVDSCLILAIYVDDGLVVSKDKEKVQTLLKHLKQEFEIKISTLNMFLGIQLKRCHDGSIIAHQTLYTQKIITRFKMESAHPVTVPADSNQSLSTLQVNKGEDPLPNIPYREAVGSLLFLSMITRPDIVYAVNSVSQYCSNFQKAHWEAVKRIIKYLKGTLGFGIKFTGDQVLNLAGFTDSDFAGESKTRRSTSGYILKFGNCPVVWGSKKQTTVALSTAEAEFVAACQTTVNLIWGCSLIQQLLKTKLEPPTLYIDNQSAISWINNGQFESKSKHIDVKYKFIFEGARQNKIIPKYINTIDQQADIFTKPLARKRFEKLRDLIGIVNCVKY